jgi:ketosteroid isomerase-like protein
VVDLSQSAAAGAGARPTPPAKAGPEEALRQWELTMRSGDAGAQSAYYAVPVQQYMWKHNVTRRDLETIKQKEISQRHGTWTMTMENVDIKRQGDTADVTFVKHITEQPQGGGQPRERRIHSKLTMKNSLGIWWIISERDIYPNKQVASDGDEFNPDEGETPSWAQPAPAAVATGATPSSASPN